MLVSIGLLIFVTLIKKNDSVRLEKKIQQANELTVSVLGEDLPYGEWLRIVMDTEEFLRLSGDDIKRRIQQEMIFQEQIGGLVIIGGVICPFCFLFVYSSFVSLFRSLSHDSRVIQSLATCCWTLRATISSRRMVYG